MYVVPPAVDEETVELVEVVEVVVVVEVVDLVVEVVVELEETGRGEFDEELSIDASVDTSLDQ